MYTKKKFFKGSFAEQHLNKYGWQEGQGLGRNEHGMKEAIKIKIKNDTAGVGHDPGKEFTLHWWDHAFNKAAGNINVNETEEGVDVTKEESNQKNGKTMFNKDMLYGRFVKGATLENDQDGVSQEVKHGDDSDSEEDEPASVSKLSDEDLFKKCGGLTAHKAARHGFKLNGKLLRVQRQESEMHKSDGISPVNGKDVDVTSKDGKKIKRVVDENETMSKENANDYISEDLSEKKAKKRKHSALNVSEVVGETEDQRRKKKKKSKKSKDKPEIATEEVSVVDPITSTDLTEANSELPTRLNVEVENEDQNNQSRKKKKKSKRNKNNPEIASQDGGITVDTVADIDASVTDNDITESDSKSNTLVNVDADPPTLKIESPDLKNSKKKKKSKKNRDVDVNDSVEIEVTSHTIEPEVKSKKKKKKTKKD